MLEHRSDRTRRRSERPPFARILCAVDHSDISQAAIDQAIAIADGDAGIVFAATFTGPDGDDIAERAATRAREAGVEATARYFPTPQLADALVSAAAAHDLVVVGAPSHSRATGIVLSETATVLLHRSPLPVLVAREGALDRGVVVATRALPADRPAMMTATHVAARLGAELTVVHVPERGDDRRRKELDAELANARSLLGRSLDYVEFDGPAARSIVDVADGDGAGLVVLGSESKQGLPALRSVSERVAHLAPCSVLVMRKR
jgi:nucleotide-binding universal stress UspA family protein